MLLSDKAGRDTVVEECMVPLEVMAIPFDEETGACKPPAALLLQRTWLAKKRGFTCQQKLLMRNQY
jgi:hypothetical protein